MNPDGPLLRPMSVRYYGGPEVDGPDGDRDHPAKMAGGSGRVPSGAIVCPLRACAEIGDSPESLSGITRVPFRENPGGSAPVLPATFSERATPGLRESGNRDDIGTASLLRSCSERPCHRRGAQQRDELAPFQLIELHPISRQPAPNCRISNSRGSVRRCQSDFATH